MADVENIRRVMLAVTETSPLEVLWQSLVEHVAGSRAEVLTVFVSDDTWRRVASLPFAVEISRISGTRMAFTQRRAEQLGEDAAGRMRQRLEQLAAGTNLQLVFEVLTTTETGQVRRLVDIERDLLIAPSLLKGMPWLSELAGRHRQVLLVEVDDQSESR
jgi:hypothetical protein